MSAAPHDAVAGAVGREFAGLLARPLACGLYLVATPIGHLGDITLRALATLTLADAVYCEDTRHSRKLLDRYGVRRKLLIYEEHSAEAARPAILASLDRGESVALMSDAGTPLISDPGFKLVRAVLEAGFPAISLPGASAPLVALTASGLPTDCFTFAGFLPAKAGQRHSRLTELKAAAGTLILFEAPGRLGETLVAMAEVFGSERPAAVARELTKLHEELHRGTLADLAAWAGTADIRGECVILVAAASRSESEASDQEITEALAAISGASLRDRVDAVAGQLRAPRRRVYDIALKAKRD